MDSGRGLGRLPAAAIALTATAVCVTAVWAVASPGLRPRLAPRPVRPAPPPESLATLTVAAPKPAAAASPLSIPAVSIVTLSPQAPLPRPGRDQFLNLPVRTTDALVKALRESPRLRRLYARHFGISEDRVVEFTRDALVLTALPRAMEITTFGVRRSGAIYPIRQRLRKGALVWATRSGQPILKWQCSNPIGKSMPGTRLNPRPVAARPQPARPVVHGIDVNPARPAPTADLPPAPAMTPALAEEPFPDNPPIDVADAPEVSGEAVAEMRGSPHGLFNLRGGIPYLGLSGLTSLILLPPGTPRTPRIPPTTVPEPGAFALIAVAGGAALRLWRRRDP